jgi:hypothetical protein
MADNNFTKFVPGFEFLQGLVKNAGSALPGIGQWVAPTLNPEELSKRIEELRTVQFWLEQNARMLGATIQALEVQRMTLSTLQTMNVPLAELREALKVPTPDTAAAWPGMPADIMAAAAKAAPAASRPTAKPAEKPKAAPKPAAAAAAVDPMQWWGALSQQFTQLAANAMKDNATDAAKNLAGAIVKQSFDAAGETLKKAATGTGTMAGSMVGSMAKGLAPRVMPKTGQADAREAAKPAAKTASTAASTAASKSPSKAAAKSAARKRKT